MRRDYLNNPISAVAEATHAAIDDFVGGLLAYETRAERVLLAAEKDPDCCLVNIYAGFLWMLLEAPEGAQRATRYLEAAELAAGNANSRERLNLALLRAWIADDLAAALQIADRISDDFPHDLAVVKLHHYLEFNRGNSPEMLRVALKVMRANDHVAHMHGMAAFAYEQCHRLDEAERCARAALERLPKEPWAQHALAHVHLTRAEVDEGASTLAGFEASWTGLNSFMLTHLWWHLALFRLAQGRGARALDLYDQHVWGVVKSYSQDQIGAVSLLARLELAGVDVGERWQELGAHLAARAADTVQPFLTLQYLYGLARAGRAEAEELLGAVRRRSGEAPAYCRAVWHEVALPACEGLYAHARGDYETAWRALGTVLPRLEQIGGSHAQRGLFDQILFDAARKCGRPVEARKALERHGSMLRGAS
ncbi:MAG TPA: tetratricopeptide repeat protein [Steroidobacteraceae bacterium]|nr:tetratricopeptide repeat protein [Steroidobacteraceae bacterium]